MSGFTCSDSVFHLIEILGKKWMLGILYCMDNGCGRFSTIQSALHGVNTKVLTDRLLVLVEQGYIEKHVIKQQPRTIRYVLTDKGVELAALAREIFETKE